MPISADIYRQFAPRPVDPQDVTNGLMQQEHARMALENNALGMQERRARLADRPALQARADEEHAAKLGLIKAQTGHQDATAGKERVQTQGLSLENAHKRTVQLAERWGTVRTPQDVVPLYVQAVNDGLMTREQAEAEINKTPQDPAQFQAYAQAQLQQGMTVAQRMKQALDEKQQSEQVRQFGVTSGMTAQRDANHAAVARGQLGVSQGNLALARQREGREAQAPKGTYDSDRGLIVDPRTGETKPVTAGGAPIGPKERPVKPMNDAQSKAALFGSRMEASNKVLESLATEGTTTSIPGARAGFGVGPTLNVLSSSKQQQLNQAKRDFVNAVLRRESGAVISDAEFDNAEKQYFPQVGDGDAVKKQKADNRAIAIRGVQAEVPPEHRGTMKEIQGGATASWGDVPPDISAILQKHGKK
jgi:hypothetical protein